jgi:hypothetical protein
MFTKARRDATLINLGATLMMSSICSCLLSVVSPNRALPLISTHPYQSLYTNEYLGPEPNKPLCILQAAAFGASGPMFVLLSHFVSGILNKAHFDFFFGSVGGPLLP